MKPWLSRCRVVKARGKIRVMDAEWFKTRMKQVRVTQEELAERLGRHRDVVRRILSGTQTMRIDEALVFADALRVPYAEILRRAGVEVPTAAIDETVPLRYHVADAFAAVSSGPIPESEQSLFPRPPRRNLPETAFAADVLDDSADRYYRRGAVVICVPPPELGRALTPGDRCVYVNYGTDMAAADAIEARIGVLAVAGDGSGLLLSSATRNADKRQTVFIEREQAAISGQTRAAEAAPGRFVVPVPEQQAEIEYTPHSDDKSEIVGVILWAFTPEA